MKWLGGLAAIAAFGLMLYTCALPGDLPAGRTGSGIAGTYTVNGVHSSGEEYSGTVVITETTGPDRFDLEWLVTGTIQRGTGVQRGDRLTVEWQSVVAADGDIRGGGSYRIDPDGRLIGTRTVVGVDEPSTEELFPDP